MVIDIARARLPDSYIKARDALKKFAKQFTPERYALAVVALGEAWAADEGRYLAGCKGALGDLRADGGS